MGTGEASAPQPSAPEGEGKLRSLMVKQELLGIQQRPEHVLERLLPGRPQGGGGVGELLGGFGLPGDGRLLSASALSRTVWASVAALRFSRGSGCGGSLQRRGPYRRPLWPAARGRFGLAGGLVGRFEGLVRRGNLRQDFRPGPRRPLSSAPRPASGSQRPPRLRPAPAAAAVGLAQRGLGVVGRLALAAASAAAAFSAASLAGKAAATAAFASASALSAAGRVGQGLHQPAEGGLGRLLLVLHQGVDILLRLGRLLTFGGRGGLGSGLGGSRPGSSPSGPPRRPPPPLWPASPPLRRRRGPPPAPRGPCANALVGRLRVGLELRRRPSCPRRTDSPEPSAASSGRGGRANADR